ncbi:hypothetical protein Hdeb2414_s0001g00037591 [Helianthus debilis subsp. tardiflorus]
MANGILVDSAIRFDKPHTELVEDGCEPVWPSNRLMMIDINLGQSTLQSQFRYHTV